MTDQPDPSEQTEPTDPPVVEGRRVSRRHQVDQGVREQRRELIATMLLTRTSYRDMVGVLRERLGIEVAISTISSDVAVLKERWQRRAGGDFAAHVGEQMAYYDGLLRAVAPRAFAGNHNAVQDLLGVLDRRAKLIGLDQPDRLLFLGAQVPVASVAEAWAGAPPDEQIARTEQILAIIQEAVTPATPPIAGLPAANGNGHALDV